MSFNQWKFFKDTISKLTNDKSLQNPIRKDIFQILNKLPLSLVKIDLLKYVESKSTALTKSVVSNESTVNLVLVFKDWKNKLQGTKEESGEYVSKWKQSSVTAEFHRSKTDQILLSIEGADNEDSLLMAIEALISHMKQHSEARNKAVKFGAVRLLLKIRATTKNDLIQAAIREGLAILGYSDPVCGRGIRILSIDGGGIRGILVLEMLRKLEELTGKRVHELFDFFCGVSTGTILSLSMGVHLLSLDKIISEYENLSREVFKQSAIRGTGNLVLSRGYYNTALWEKKLKEHLGDNTLISTARSPHCPKLSAVSAVVNQSRLMAYVFRNYSSPIRLKSQYLGGYDYKVWEAARASAAAPTYFEEFKLGNFVHQDGGILVNNPAAIAIHEAKQLWPTTPIQCVVSFGTGRTVPPPSEFFREPIMHDNPSGSSSWANTFNKILASATDTEGVHTMLNDLLPEKVYYRFNPYLTELISMVETDAKKIDQLKKDAIMYLRRNEDKFHEAAKTLTEKKKFTQKVADYLYLKREMYGF